jgi:hypothetical protein
MKRNAAVQVATGGEHHHVAVVRDDELAVRGARDVSYPGQLALTDDATELALEREHGDAVFRNLDSCNVTAIRHQAHAACPAIAPKASYKSAARALKDADAVAKLPNHDDCVVGTHAHRLRKMF